jgi:hypothetical protein
MVSAKGFPIYRFNFVQLSRCLYREIVKNMLIFMPSNCVTTSSLNILVKDISSVFSFASSQPTTPHSHPHQQSPCLPSPSSYPDVSDTIHQHSFCIFYFQQSSSVTQSANELFVCSAYVLLGGWVTMLPTIVVSHPFWKVPAIFPTVLRSVWVCLNQKRSWAFPLLSRYPWVLFSFVL